MVLYESYKWNKSPIFSSFSKSGDKESKNSDIVRHSGARSVTVTAAGINESKFITLVLKASAATTMTWNGITKWVDKDEAAPSWGNSGAILVVQLALVGSKVLASTLYNSQA